MGARGKPRKPTAPPDPAAEERRRLAEADRQRREAEAEARRREWAEAAPTWQHDWRNGGKERAAAEAVERAAVRAERERVAREQEAERERKRQRRRAAWEARQPERDAKKAERLKAEEERRRRGYEEFGRRWVEELLHGSGPGPFEVLGLAPTATLDQLKARHRELAMRHHPDRGGDVAEFRRYQSAYEKARRIIEDRSAA